MIVSLFILGATTYIVGTIYDIHGRSGKRRQQDPADQYTQPRSGATRADGQARKSSIVDEVNGVLDAAYDKGAALARKALGATTEDQRRTQLATLTDGDGQIVVSPEERDMRRRLTVATGLVGAYVGGALLFPPLTVVALVGIAYQAVQLTIDAVKDTAETGKVRWSALVAVWMTSTFVTGHFAVALFVGFPVYLALLWTAKTRDASIRKVNNILGEEPQSVWLLVDGVEVEWAFDRLEVGAHIVLYGGEHIPVDGRVIDGQGEVDQHLLTGEVKPVFKAPGDDVYAGTLLLTGKLVVAVTAMRSETAAAQIGDALANTLDYRDVSELRATTMTDRIALPALAISGVTWGALGAGSATAALTMQPGYHLPWAGPLNVMNHLDLCVDEGILIKDGRALERLAEVDTIVFDKTGTLTHPTPQVVDIHCEDPQDPDWILGVAAAIEAKQSHPLAQAIRDAAHKHDVPLPVLADVELVPGMGVKSMSHGHPLLVGSTRLMRQENVALSTRARRVLDKNLDRGHLSVFVAIDGQVAGIIELSTIVRAEAREVMEALRRRGLDLFIMSGDHAESTRQLAQSVGVPHYFAEVLPNDKAALIDQMQREGRTICFVGDGINDSIALKKSHVSVSLRGATSIAVNVAQIILREGDLRSLIPMFELGQSYDEITKRNVKASTLLGVANIAAISLLHTGVTVAAILCMTSSGLIGVNSTLSKRRQEATTALGQRLIPTK